MRVQIPPPLSPNHSVISEEPELFPFSYLTLLVCVKRDEWSVWSLRKDWTHTHTHTVRQTAVGLGRSARDSLSEELTGWSELQAQVWRHVGPNVVCMCGLSVCVLEVLTLLFLLVSGSKM